MPLELNSGDTAWMLTSAALVLLMTPGLALFYGGMVRAKSVLNMMMMSFGALALVSILWVLYGYSFAFGNDIGYGLLGNPTEFIGLKGLMADADSTYPAMAFVAFQAVFAIITVALISGAIADRAKFSTWMIFVGIWASLVYFPVAHWVFDFTLTDDNDVVTHTGGWIANNLAALDFAGGTAVHINAGVAGLALAIVLGKRLGWRKEPMRPHNLTLVMLGAGLLWFGWFGFNAGSAVSAGNTAAVAWVNTLVATAAASLGWLLTERIPRRPPDLARCRLRRRGRPGRHHTGRPLGISDRRHHSRRDRRCALRAGGRAEVQARLRRLARRGRRAPGRRPVGHPVHRPARHRGSSRRRERAVLRRWGRPAVAAGRGCLRACCSTA